MQLHEQTKNRGLFHTRDSSARHEMTPGEYVSWAQRKALELGVTFKGTPAMIEAMIHHGESHRGDIFLDFGVSGNILDRPGLTALLHEITSDRNVKYIFIPRRNRLARPNDPLDGVRLENSLRRMGCWIVYMETILEPIGVGSRQNIGDLITSLVAFNSAGEDRRELAQKVLFAKIALARAGFATGGRAPFGFRRWLVKEDGTRVRQLADKERVRMAGHHVVHLPVEYDHPDMILIRRILSMLEIMPGCRVAAALTAEEIPTPDAGRTRTDNGVKHLTSGVWHQTTISNIARNPLLLALTSFGQRSMGDQLRFAPDGPRELNSDDFRRDNGKPKIIRNPKSQLIQRQATFEPPVEVDRHLKLLDKLDARGGSQKGKPRSHDPAMNPLGGRVFDLGCAWLMYRAPYQGSFRYSCGLYQQSHGQQCDYNHVDGPAAARFLLACLRQRGMLSPSFLPKLRQRLEELTRVEKQNGHSSGSREDTQQSLRQLEAQIEKVGENLALASNPKQFQQISSVFDRLTAEAEAKRAELAKLELEQRDEQRPFDKIETAVAAFERLPELADNEENFGRIGELLTALNAKLFVGFQPEKIKKRTVNRLTHGVATFGAATPPITIYEGPTARKRIKCEQAALAAAQPGESAFPPTLPDDNGPGRRGNSLRNVNRGDMI